MWPSLVFDSHSALHVVIRCNKAGSRPLRDIGMHGNPFQIFSTAVGHFYLCWEMRCMSVFCSSSRRSLRDVNLYFRERDRTLCILLDHVDIGGLPLVIFHTMHDLQRMCHTWKHWLYTYQFIELYLLCGWEPSHHGGVLSHSGTHVSYMRTVHIDGVQKVRLSLGIKYASDI